LEGGRSRPLRHSGTAVSRPQGAAPRPEKGWWVEAAAAVLRHPDVWPTAFSQLKAMAPAGWWKRLPPVPAPSPAWLAFRMETAYGDGHARPSADELVALLRWCRESRRSSGRVH
jgi:hypothetical protein